MNNTNFLNIEFEDLIDLKTIQQFQDSFSDATGVASIITKPDGTPITKPSNFCSLCTLIRKTQKGLANCYHSDAIIGRQNEGGPIYQKCLSGGLWDGGASISVGGKHIANWLIGQVITQESDEQKILDYANEIGADKNEFKNELQNVTRMPLEQFKKIANSLSIFANELSNKAYQNLQLKIHQEHLEFLVKEKTKELETAIEELRATNEELYSKNDIINNQNASLKKALKDLKATQIQLIQSEKLASLGVLTAGVSHEINNPLNFIMGSYAGFESYFKTYQSQDEELTSKLLEAMQLGIERTSNIVKGLNQFSRDTGNFNEDCNIHGIIMNCLMMLQSKITNRITISKNYTIDNITTLGNSGKLHQVVLNILTNAIDSIEKQGAITITTGIRNKTIFIEISDNGCGIQEDRLPLIMDPFFTTKPPGKGTGLGLYISNSIINEHNGSLVFESTKGEGTKATINLPTKKQYL